MPLVSRLEDQTQTPRCHQLRQAISACLFSLLERYIQAQYILQPLTDSINLEKYYDIYDISQEELADAESGLADRANDQNSLRALRTLFRRLYSVRKSILCCLLALSTDGGSNIGRWSIAVEEMRNLGTTTGVYTTKIADILNEEDRKYFYFTKYAS